MFSRSWHATPENFLDLNNLIHSEVSENTTVAYCSVFGILGSGVCKGKLMAFCWPENSMYNFANQRKNTYIYVTMNSGLQ